MSSLLVIGVVLWSLVHGFPALMPAQRRALLDSMGNAYKMIFALLIVVSLVLIVWGWRASVPQLLYQPPIWTRHVTMLLMLIAVLLIGLSHSKSRVKRVIRHPMLWGVVVWSIAHLLSNGDSRSLVLFGGLLIWSVVSILMINRRDGAWHKPELPGSMASEIKWLVISIVLYVALVFLHPYFTGMSLMTSSL